MTQEQIQDRLKALWDALDIVDLKKQEVPVEYIKGCPHHGHEWAILHTIRERYATEMGYLRNQLPRTSESYVSGPNNDKTFYYSSVMRTIEEYGF